MSSSIAPLKDSMVLLAPPRTGVLEAFRRVDANPARHATLLGEMQRFRGAIYLQDGAIEAWQMDQGRHKQATDETSWHLLALDRHGRVCGCVRYRHYENSASYRDLSVRNSALARSPEWGQKLRAAIESEMEVARFRDFGYAEVGGWAIAEERRGTLEALKVALATYSLAEILGGTIGLTTATVRHGSSSILRRMGGSSIQWDGALLPPYYDPQYKCVMEILRFDSSAPEGKYRPWITRIAAQLIGVPVICADRGGDWKAAADRMPVAMLSAARPAQNHVVA